MRHVMYAVRMPLPVLGTARRFGNILHAAREAYEKKGRSLEAAIEVLEGRSAGLSPGDREEARSILGWVDERSRGREGHPILIEGPLRTSVAGHRLEVRLDRLDRVGEGLVLVEYKTGRRVELEPVRAQMRVLAHVVSSVFGKTPARWEVELLRARRGVDIPAETDPGALERFTAELARSVARGDRDPRPYDPAFCRRCAARPYCPRMAASPKPLREPVRREEAQLLLFP
jgi:hypothetical protein